MLSDEIRAVVDRHSIVDVLQHLGCEPPAGWNGSSDFMVSCPSPTHEDSTPSCIVHTQTDRYYCFGCGVHGDVLQLARDVAGVKSIREAAEVLEGGSIRPTAEPMSIPARPVNRTDVELQRTSRDRVLAVNEAAWRELTRPSGVRIADGYLARRGLDVQRLNRLVDGPAAGYSPSGANGLVSRLRSFGFCETEILDAGWGVRTDTNNLIDRFRRRVVFPYRDDGRLVGVIGRDVSGQARQKYINTPTTAAFQKSAFLYEPLAEASQDVVVICEGPLDALAVVTNSRVIGFKAVSAVAVSGTALTLTHSASLKRAGGKRVVLFPDGDPAGDAARRRWRQTCEEVGLLVSDGRVPPGLDPASWITSVAGEFHIEDTLSSRPCGH